MLLKKIKNILIIINLRLFCLVGIHGWTSLAEQNIAPDPVKIKNDPIGYFEEYARMYCKTCSKVYISPYK